MLQFSWFGGGCGHVDRGRIAAADFNGDGDFHKLFLPVVMLSAVMRLAWWVHQQAQDDDARDQQQDDDLLRGGHGRAVVAVVFHCGLR